MNLQSTLGKARLWCLSVSLYVPHDVILKKHTNAASVIVASFTD